MEIYIDRISGGVVLSPSILTYSITVDDNFTASKTIGIVEGEKQKINDVGQPIYLDTDGNETTEAVTVTKYEDREMVNIQTDEDGKEHSEVITVQEPVEWINNEPIMIPNIILKTVTFAEDTNAFTVEEILQAKYQKILDVSSYDYILADMFLNEEDIDLADKDHAANTGIALMQLLPNGQAKTKPITLTAPAASFELLEFDAPGVDVYLSGKKFTDGKLVLTTPVASCTIKFVNTTNRPIEIKSYAIAY